MTTLAGLLVLALVSAVQEKDNPKPDPPKETVAGKPDPKKKALELLDRAAEMVSAAQPEVQVAGLLHLGDSYRLFDKKKALQLLEQAFASALTLPSTSEQFTRILSDVVSVTAQVDV